MTDLLMRDDRGRPTGLNWAAITVETEAPVLTKNPKPKPKPKHKGKCGNGHDKAQYRKTRKDGKGGYCVACKNERSAEYRKQGKQKEYRQRKKAEREAAA